MLAIFDARLSAFQITIRCLYRSYNRVFRILYKVARNDNLVIKGFNSSIESFLQRGSTLCSLDPKSNAYPSLLAWHKLVSLRLLDTF